MVFFANCMHWSSFLHKSWIWTIGLRHCVSEGWWCLLLTTENESKGVLGLVLSSCPHQLCIFEHVYLLCCYVKWQLKSMLVIWYSHFFLLNILSSLTLLLKFMLRWYAHSYCILLLLACFCIFFEIHFYTLSLWAVLYFSFVFSLFLCAILSWECFSEWIWKIILTT